MPIATVSSNRLRPEYIVFVVLFFSYAYFFQSGEHNENARFDQVRAIVEEHSLSITSYHYNTADLIQRFQYFYPNKPPGLSFLAAPAWWLARVILDPLDSLPELKDHLTCYLVTIFTVGLAGALLGLLMYLTLEPELGRNSALLLTFAYSLGTLALPFSTLFFSHQVSALLLFGSFAILLKSMAPPSKRFAQFPKVCLAGILASYSIVLEYPGAIAVLWLSLFALFGASGQSAGPLNSLQRFSAFALGSLLPILLLATYNSLVFDNPWAVTYGVYARLSHAAFSGHSTGIFGVGAPSLSVLWEITFGLQRGLFVFNPWLICIFPALFFWRGTQYKARVIALCIVISFFLFNAGYGDSVVYWGGGHSTGPRHLIPALPFLVFFVSPLFQIRLVRMLFTPVIAISVVIMLMATAIEPRIPYEYGNPIGEFLWPHFRTAQFSLLNRGVFSDLFITGTSVAFNLGQIWGVPRAWVLAPLVLSWIVAATALIFSCCTSRNELNRTGIEVAGTTLSGLGLVIFIILIPCFGFVPKSDLPKQGNGMFASYFHGIPSTEALIQGTFVTTPAIERIDPSPCVDWRSSPMPMRPPFTVMWQGFFKAPAGGLYTFSAEADDGAILIIDDKMVVDSLSSHSGLLLRGELRLAAGNHRTKVILINKMFGAYLKLAFKPLDSGVRMLGVADFEYDLDQLK